MALNARQFAGEADLIRMLELVGQSARLTGPIGHMHLCDVLWRRYMLDDALVDPTRNVRLWEDGETLVGFGWFGPPGFLETQLHPESDPAILDEMCAWAESRAVEATKAGDSPSSTSDCYESDDAKRAVLEARGYQRQEDDFFVLNSQSLAGEPPPPILPAGAVVRPVDGAHEITERVEIHREVWHPSRVTETAYRCLRAAPGYRPDLDLVAVAPDGALAAYCICWYDPISRSGAFEPVGARAAYRGQGYGKAVVTEGLHRLRALGAETAIVFSHGGEVPAERLYASCGFQPLTRTYDYRKTLESGSSGSD